MLITFLLVLKLYPFGNFIYSLHRKINRTKQFYTFLDDTVSKVTKRTYLLFPKYLITYNLHHFSYTNLQLLIYTIDKNNNKRSEAVDICQYKSKVKYINSNHIKI